MILIRFSIQIHINSRYIYFRVNLFLHHKWSGFYLQVNIPPWLGKICRFKVFRLLENVFCKTPTPFWHDLALVSPCRTIPPYIYPPPSKFFPPWKFFLEKSPSSPHLMGGDTMKGSLKMKLKAKGTSWNSNKKDKFMARYCTFLYGSFLWAA